MSEVGKNMIESDSQNAQILVHLMTEGPISPLQALRKYNCFRLAARIHDLRMRGHKIITERRKRNGKIVAVYRLEIREKV